MDGLVKFKMNQCCSIILDHYNDLNSKIMKDEYVTEILKYYTAVKESQRDWII